MAPGLEVGVLADGSPTAAVELLLLFLIVATGLGIVARRLSVPYPVLLVVGGLAIGFIPGLPRLELEPDIVFLLFLPPILFSAGYFTSARDLQTWRRPIISLAVVLVLITTAVVALVAKTLVPDLPWAAAITLGAIVSPPDAVAATAIFERLGVPRRAVAILEGESLLNDATALVVYRLAVGAAMGGAVSVASAASTFVIAALGGIVIGLAVGWVTTAIVRRVNEPVFAIVITFLAPVAAYLPATELGLSGVLATVVAGIYLGRTAPRGLSSAVRVAALSAWQVLLFLITSAVFLLIGLQLPTVLVGLSGFSPIQLIGLGLAISAAAIVTRLLWVFPSAYVPRLVSSRIRDREERPAERLVFLIGWAGMRGVVSLAAALALPIGFPERNLVIFLTFSVILATLVGQGLTLTWLTGRLALNDVGDAVGREEATARYVAANSALGRLEELATEWPDHLPLIDRLKSQYEDRTRHAVAAKHPEQVDEAAEQELIEHRQIRMAVLGAEREALLNLRERGAVSDEVYRIVERDLDLEELRMEV